MSVINLSEQCFQMEMLALESNQQIIALSLYDNIGVLNESIVDDKISKIKEMVSKILDKIAMFIDKVIQTGKEKFATIGFSGAKKKMEQIKQSSKTELSSDIKLKSNTNPFVTKDKITANDLTSLTGIHDFSDEKVKFEVSHEFIKDVVKSDKNPNKYSIDEFKKVMGISNTDNKNDDQNIIKEKMDKQKAIDLVEKQIKQIDTYINSDFKGCLNELVKIRNDARRQSRALKKTGNIIKHGFSFSLNLSKDEMIKYMQSAAIAYSSYIHIMTQYMFGIIREQMSIMKYNISQLSKDLL